jgi:hypothetical protein
LAQSQECYGTSGLSNPAEYGAGPPSAPAAPILTLGDNCINVSRTPVAGATGYEVHYFAGSSEILHSDFNMGGNSYTIPLQNLDYGTGMYIVWIIAKVLSPVKRIYPNRRYENQKFEDGVCKPVAMMHLFNN